MDISVCYSRLRAAQRELSNNLKKIARLLSARMALQNQLSQVEGNAQDQANAAKNKASYGGWEGITQMKTQDTLRSVTSMYSRYILQIDDIFEEINESMRYLKDRNDELRSRIRMLEDMIDELQEAGN